MPMIFYNFFSGVQILSVLKAPPVSPNSQATKYISWILFLKLSFS